MNDSQIQGLKETVDNIIGEVTQVKGSDHYNYIRNNLPRLAIDNTHKILVSNESTLEEFGTSSSTALFDILCSLDKETIDEIITDRDILTNNSAKVNGQYGLSAHGIDTALIRIHSDKVPGHLKIKKSEYNIKLGIDPTSPDMHIGHLPALLRMKKLLNRGYNGVMIMGNFTATIGDPSGKNEERPALSEEKANENAQMIREQVENVLGRKSRNVWFYFNRTGIDMLKPSELAGMKRYLSESLIEGRVSFKNKRKEKVPINLGEKDYPLYQGLDSLLTYSIVELGGTDQIANVKFARELQGKEPIKSIMFDVYKRILENNMPGWLNFATMYDENKGDSGDSGDSGNSGSTSIPVLDTVLQPAAIYVKDFISKNSVAEIAAYLVSKIEPEAGIFENILEGTDGVSKMSKSKGNVIYLKTPPREMFKEVMRIEDFMVPPYLKTLTEASEEEVNIAYFALDPINLLEAKGGKFRSVYSNEIFHKKDNSISSEKENKQKKRMKTYSRKDLVDYIKRSESLSAEQMDGDFAQADGNQDKGISIFLPIVKELEGLLSKYDNSNRSSYSDQEIYLDYQIVVSDPENKKDTGFHIKGNNDFTKDILEKISDNDIKKNIDYNPVQIKQDFAYRLVCMLHGKEEAEDAKEYFKRVVRGKGIVSEKYLDTKNFYNLSMDLSEGDKSINLEMNFKEKGKIPLSHLLFAAGLTDSLSGSKRIIKQGGVSIGHVPEREMRYDMDQIKDVRYEVSFDDLDRLRIQAGKGNNVMIKYDRKL